MKFAILAVCVAAVAAKPHAYLYNGPAPTYGVAPAPAQPQQKYNGPPAPLGQDGRVIDTDEVARLTAEHLETLARLSAEAAANEAMEAATTPAAPAASDSHSGGYSDEAPVQNNQGIPASTYGVAPAPPQSQQKYNGPSAPLGPDGRVIDTDEVARLKAVILETLAKANALAAAIEAMEATTTPAAPAALDSHSGGYSHEAPVQETHVIPASTYGVAPAPVQRQQKYNGPSAPLGPDGRVIDTEEVARLTAEHLETLARLSAEAAANEAMEAATTPAAPAASDSPSGGYSYDAPVQNNQGIPASTYGVASAPPQSQQKYNGPSAPLGPDGRVIDTDEVARLTAEHLETLARLSAEAAANEAMEAATTPAAPAASDSPSGGYSYDAPVQNNQGIPASTYGVASAPPQSQQKYNGPSAPLGPDGRVIDTDDVAKLKAEHLETLAKLSAEAAAIKAMVAATTPAAPASGSHSGGYSHEAPAQNNQGIPASTFDVKLTPAQPQQKYNGPSAPLGPDGRVIDTDDVAKLKAEILETLAKLNAEAAAVDAMEAAITSTSPVAWNPSSIGGYIYEAPDHRAQGIPAATYGVASPPAQSQQKYNGPAAPLGPDGRVIDTDDVARLKAEILETLAKLNAEAAAIDAMEAATTPAAPAAPGSHSGGYTYETPAQNNQGIPASTVDVALAPAQPQQKYNGPSAPLGPDGRVIDTDDVAKLKAEILETLAKLNAEAAAIDAMEAATTPAAPAAIDAMEAATTPAAPAAPGSHSGGYSYEKPAQNNQGIPAPTVDVALAPAQPQQKYNGPSAPLGPDGRVIDTDDVARLKAEILETLAKLNAQAAAIEAMEAASNSSSSDGYVYEKTRPKFETPSAPANDAPAAPSSSSPKGYIYQKPTKKFETPSSPTYGTPAPSYGAPVAKPQQVYNGPAAPLGLNGAVVDTDDVARLKADHIAALEKANAAAAAAKAASGPSSEEEGYYHEEPVPKFNAPTLATLEADNAALAQAAVPLASAESAPSSSDSSAEVPKRYSGPYAPLSADGQVIDTDEVAQLKAAHLAAVAKATAEAIAYASSEETDEDNKYLPPLPAQKAHEGRFKGY